MIGSDVVDVAKAFATGVGPGRHRAGSGYSRLVSSFGQTYGLMPPFYQAGTGRKVGGSLVASVLVDDTAYEVRLVPANADVSILLEVPNVTESLDLIKERLALSMTQLSEIFGVTRKAVYDWYGGSAPRPENANRIALLADIFSSLPPEVDAHKIKAFWLMRVSGASLLDVLREEYSSERLRDEVLAKIHEIKPKILATNVVALRSLDMSEASFVEFDRPSA